MYGNRLFCQRTGKGTAMIVNRRLKVYNTRGLSIPCSARFLRYMRRGGRRAVWEDALCASAAASDDATFV